MSFAKARTALLLPGIFICFSTFTFAQGDAGQTRQLAEKLSTARTADERDALLAAQKELMTFALVEALGKRVDELRFKGDFDEALRLSRETVAVADRIGDPA